jgi:hypothetical protein
MPRQYIASNLFLRACSRAAKEANVKSSPFGSVIAVFILNSREEELGRGVAEGEGALVALGAQDGVVLPPLLPDGVDEVDPDGVEPPLLPDGVDAADPEELLLLEFVATISRR